MATCVDSRGVLRGRCTLCNCAAYNGGASGMKCVCLHPPGKHQNLSSDQNQPIRRSGIAPSLLYADVLSSGPPTSPYSGSASSYDYKPPVTGTCKAKGCMKSCHYEPTVGEFDYCSPSCRDKDILSNEKQRLLQDLKTFEDKIKSTTPITNEKYGGRSPQGYASGSNPVSFYGKHTPTPGAHSNLPDDHNASGKQETVQVIIKKSPGKDIGFIISDQNYNEGSISGVLILGFEFDSVAEHHFERGEVRLLDVITSVNGQEANQVTYVEEMKKGSVKLIVNRSVALPEIRDLLGKAKPSKPSLIVAVMNPKTSRVCFAEKGFGLTISVTRSKLTVNSVPEKTPARFSRIKYVDEIVAFGFVKNNKLKVGTFTQDLTNVALDLAACDGKTLVLALKRAP